jgi:hypothetical protein
MGKKSKEKTQISIAKIGLIGAIAAATITFIGILISAYIGYLGDKAQIEKPIHATQTAENVKLATEFVNGTQLPKSTAPSFSLSLVTSQYWLWVGLIKIPIDRNQLSQSIESSMVSMPDDIYNRFGDTILFPNTTHLILSGRPFEKPTYISNRIPVKILSIQAVPETVDMQVVPIGGGDDVWLFSLELSSASIKLPDQIAWASYSSDLRAQLSERWEEIKDINKEEINSIDYPLLYGDPLLYAPTEIIKYISGESPKLPDYFQIKENEMIVFSIASIFKEPGIYTIDFGIEYIIDGYKNIAWVDHPLKIFVPNNYYLWGVSEYGNTSYDLYLSAICTYTPNKGHTCEGICQYTVDGLNCR